ncbi:MAG: uroporphyrinogen-III synthase [Notoacmeibacter sp.]|nr:uroporphyrinogen-III synthase [Notoacmeibacter sp.]
MAGLRVLVTRPEPGASKTAETLERLGYQPIVMPLTSIETHLPFLPEPWPAFTHVVVTSANGLRHAPEILIRRLRGLTVFAVGDATARSARAAGFDSVETGGGGAAGLEAHLLALPVDQIRVAYIAGVVRRPELELFLTREGIAFNVFETYQTKKVSYSTHEIELLLGEDLVDAVLVHSAETAAALGELPAAGKIGHIIEITNFFAISERVGRALESQGARHVSAASEPSEAAMLDLLATIRG